VEKRFLKTYPVKEREAWCGGCYGTTSHVQGVVFYADGTILPGFMCTCGHIWSADKVTNPIREIEEKIDKLMSHLGLSSY
jgi:hypothetical protein